MHDLVIRNGLIVDGSGGPSFVGDIAIDAQRIVALPLRYVRLARSMGPAAR